MGWTLDLVCHKNIIISIKYLIKQCTCVGSKKVFLQTSQLKLSEQINLADCWKVKGPSINTSSSSNLVSLDRISKFLKSVSIVSFVKFVNPGNKLHYQNHSVCAPPQKLFFLVKLRTSILIVIILSFGLFSPILLYTGRLWYRMCSCQPTVGLTILPLCKFCFYFTKSQFYCWLTTAHTVP